MGSDGMEAVRMERGFLRSTGQHLTELGHRGRSESQCPVVWLGDKWVMLPLLRSSNQEGGQERMSWALVHWEGPGRHPGEPLKRPGSLGEGLAPENGGGLPRR